MAARINSTLPPELRPRVYVVNAFTTVPFTGNPAAVVIIPPALIQQYFSNSNSGDADAATLTKYLHAVAIEVSGVETVFILPHTTSTEKADYTLRFFTKVGEMRFCGHATIAAAHVLTTTTTSKKDEYTFHVPRYQKPVVSVRCLHRNNGYQYELCLNPASVFSLTGADIIGKHTHKHTDESINKNTIKRPPADTAAVEEYRVALAAALRLPNGRADIEDVAYYGAGSNIIVALSSARAVAAARPDFAALQRVCRTPHTTKVTITAVPTLEEREDSRRDTTTAPVASTRKVPSVSRPLPPLLPHYHFITRLFAPWIGIQEDAVSGASHAVLAKYWQERGSLELLPPPPAETEDENSNTKTNNKPEKQPRLRRQGRTGKDTTTVSKLLCYQLSERGGEVRMSLLPDGAVTVGSEAVIVTEGDVLRGPANISNIKNSRSKL